MLVSKYQVLSDADLKPENLIFFGDERSFRGPGWSSYSQQIFIYEILVLIDHGNTFYV